MDAGLQVNKAALAAAAADDASATSTVILREGTTGGAGGWANTAGEIGMSWGVDEIGSNEVGSFTDDYDPMRGLNVFDATMRHEIGHTVGFAHGFDSANGFVSTAFGWKEEDWRPLVRHTFAPVYSVGEDLSDDEIEFAIRGLSQATAYNKDAFQTSVDRVAANNGVVGLWDKIVDSDLLDFLLTRAEEGAWEVAADLGGRSYHVDYPPDGSWVSCPTSLYAKKVSTYAVRSPAEWFAEVYATFYADADRPGVSVGSTLAGRDTKAYGYMLKEVHTLWNLLNMTGQSMGHDTMGV